MTRTVAPTKLAPETDSGSSGVAPAASGDGPMTDTELAVVNGGSGQATGKRQHKPIRFQMIYDQ